MDRSQKERIVSWFSVVRPEMLPPEFKRIIKVTAEGNLYYVGIGKGDGADEYYVGNIVSSDGVLIKSLIK